MNTDWQPYNYRVILRGTDQVCRPIELDLDVTPTRAPVPVGADVCNGVITCFGQPGTYSYFQTGMVMNGTATIFGCDGELPRPVESPRGPFRYHGTMRGEPVSGFAFYERSPALHRDWELIGVRSDGS